MLDDKWFSLLLISILFVAAVNGLLASITPLYHRRKALNTLTHSQLRIRQGRAQLEHRLNVFTQSFLFSFASWRVYLISLVLWFLLNQVK